MLWESGKSVVKKGRIFLDRQLTAIGAPFGQACVNSLSPDCAAKNACTFAERSLFVSMVARFNKQMEKFRNSMSASKRWTVKSPVAK